MPVSAQTTGQLTGQVVDASKVPVAGVIVTAVSPTQIATAKTDTAGHFAFVSLGPDTYTLSAEKAGFGSAVLVGISVFADQTRTVTLEVLRQIGKVSNRAASDIVRAGTTSDVYSVNAAQAETAQGIGGGGNLNSAYSAIALTPGTYSAINNAGWGQTIYIHGSSYAQVGYEYDGVPVNRAFDNYNSNTLTNLGQQELQVFTGGATAGSASETVGGFINQVIKTGSYPSSADLLVSAGGPAYYNQAKIEFSGATQNHNLSYYVGYSQYKQDYRELDQFNGISNTQLSDYNYGNVLAPNYAGAGDFPNCVKGQDPFDLKAGTPGALPVGTGGDQGCINLFPYNGGGLASTQDSEFVANVHVAVPHGRQGLKDDIQFLASIGHLVDLSYDSINDLGGPAYISTLNGGSPLTYPDGYIVPPGTPYLANASTVGAAVPYYFPSSQSASSYGPNFNRTFQGPLDNYTRGGVTVDSAILKLQYQHNFSSSAFARIYGYTNYSDWLQSDAFFADSEYLSGLAGGLPLTASPDYELSTHTRGGAFEFYDQFNSNNLLSLSANYTDARTLRDNNLTWLSGLGSPATSLISGGPGTYKCYDATGAVAPCFSSSVASGTIGQPVGPAVPPGSPAALAGAQYLLTSNGLDGTYNTVRPFFQTYSLSDQFQATSKLLLNGGVRLENYHYALAPADSPIDEFWFEAAQNSYCYNPQTKLAELTPLAPGQQPGTQSPIIATTCPVDPNTGVQTLHPNGKNGALLYSNEVAGDISKTVFEPRFSGTYSVDPDTVIRFSAGKYAQPVQTAYVEYLNQSPKSNASFNFVNFWNLGFTNPEHNLTPSNSYNFDTSFEHRFKGTDLSVSFSPFYRHTFNNYQDVLIGTNFATSYPDANESAFGYEVALQKGDVSRNGLAAQLSYTFTKTSVAYLDSPTGSNVIDTINSYIDAYNGLTKAGNKQGIKGSPCYLNTVTNGTPYAGCTVSASGAITMDPAGLAAGAVINPYYDAAPQADLNPRAPYPDYQTAVTDPDTSANTVIVPPSVFAGFLNFKHDRLSITPSFQLQSGTYYGSPVSVGGIDPRTCGGNQSAVPTAPNPGLANYLTCGAALTNDGILAIPDPENGNKFDGFGEFINPWEFAFNTQVSYEFSRQAKLNVLLANLVNTCFGGTSTPSQQANPPGHETCGYGPLDYVSNFYNGASPNDVAANGTTVQSRFAHAYYPQSSGFFPFSVYVQLQLHL